MKTFFSNKISKIITTKQFFGILCVFLFLATYFLIKNNVFIKGATSSPLPVVVWDESARTTVESSSDDPYQVLKDGNISVAPEDVVTSEIILDPLKDQGAGQKIVIKRAPVYFVSVDGKLIEVRSWENAASQIIAKSGISLGAKDQIKPMPNSLVTPGETIIITRINEADVDVIEEIPFETIQKSDSSIAFGAKKVTQAGANGRIKKTYRIRYKNGVEVSRVLISNSTVSSAVDRVVASGTVNGYANYGEGSLYEGMVTAFYLKGYTGKYLLVTNLDNGKKIRVKVIGWGPTDGGLMDMGIAPFKAISSDGTLSSGRIKRVSVQLVD